MDYVSVAEVVRVTVQGNQTWYTISDLQELSHYAINITATNSSGISPPYKTTVRTLSGGIQYTLCIVVHYYGV